MKEYRCDDTFINKLVRRTNIKGAIIALLLLVVIVLIIATVNESLDGIENQMLLGIVSVVSIIVLSILLKQDRTKIDTIIANIENQYLHINETNISGIHCANPFENLSFEYFEIPFNEIKKVETDIAKVLSSEVYWNLVIYTVGKTYRLCIKDSDDAANCINIIKNQRKFNV